MFRCAVLVIGFGLSLDGVAEMVPLALWVNGASRGTHPVHLDEHHEVCLPQQVLEALGLSPWRPLDPRRRCLSLGETRKKVGVRLVVPRAELHLTIPPRWLAETVRDSTTIPRPPSRPGVDSAYLNYAVQGSRDGVGRSTLTLPLEAVVNSHGWSLEHQLTLRAGDAEPLHLVSFRSRAIHDRPERLQRWEVGQVIAPGGRFTLPRSLWGFGLSRHWGMAPSQVRFDGFQVTGLTERSATVEVWMDGRLWLREEVPAGPFRLLGPVLGSGLRRGRVVVRDTFGRERITPLQLYVPSRRLPSGRWDYALYGGWEEQQGGAAVQGRVARGLGGRGLMAGWLDGRRGEITLGGEGWMAWGRWGEGGGDWAWHLPGGGTALELQYAFVGAGWRFGVGGGRREGGSDAVSGPSRWEWVRLGWGGGRMGLWSLAWQRRGGSMIGSLSQTRRLWSGASFTVRGEHRRGATEGWWLGVEFSWWPGQGRGVGVSRYQGEATGRSELWAQRRGGRGLGRNWRLRASREDDGSLRDDARLSWNGRYFHAAIETRGTDGWRLVRGRLAGSVVFADEHWFFSRPVREAFALVDTDGVDGISIYLRRGLMGKTRHGRLLVPELGAYTVNTLRLDTENMPLAMLPQRSRAVVVPRYHQGVVVRFPVRLVRAVSGILVDGAGRPLGPDRLLVETSQGVQRGLVGRGGVFYVEGVPPGRHLARLVGSGCRFFLTVTRREGPVIDLGRLPCGN